MKPWEKYQQAGEEGPWSKYKAPEDTDEGRQTRRGYRYRESYIKRLSGKAGFPVSPESDLSFMERADLGLSDTPQERLAKWKARYPAGTYTEVPMPGKTEGIYQRYPTDTPRLVDEPGVTLKDLADRPQEMVTVPAQAGLAAMGPPGWAAQLGLQALIPGAVHLGKEGIEEARGYQQEPLGSVLGTAGIESLTDLIAGGAGAGIGATGRAIRGRNVGGPPQSLVQDMADIDAMLQLQPEAKSADLEPYLYQMRPDQPVIERIGAQMRSTSARAKRAEALQQETFADLINQYRTVQLGKAGVTLSREGERAVRKRAFDITRDFGVDREAAGKIIKGTITEDFNTKSRSAIKKAYDKAGELSEGVQFDLSPAQDVSRRVTAPVQATATETVPGQIIDLGGQPLTEETIQKLVNVKADPDGAVRTVAGLLDQIDPVQTDWRVVKELRSQVGDAIKEPRLSDASSGQAKSIYAALTDVMENPIGGGNAFVETWKNANRLARERFQIYEDAKIIDILRQDAPAEIAKAVGQNPAAFNETVRGVIRDFAPDKKNKIRDAVSSVIIGGEGSSRQALKRWETDNIAAFQFLYPTRREQGVIRDAARSMDELRAAPVNKLLDFSTAKIARGKSLLQDMGPAEIEDTLRMFRGGKNSQAGEAMRMAAFDDILQGALTTSKEGLPTLNTNKLSAAIQKAKESGVWEKVLTAEDKVKLRGFDAYVRRVFKSLSDTGTSLEQAQAIAALKHPGTFLQGFHALMVNNRVLPLFLMNRRLGKYFKPRTRQRGPSRRGTEGTWVFLGNFAHEVATVSTEETGRSD